MLEKIIHFIKYNNATVIILALVVILGGGVLAAGPEGLGEKQTSVEGLDNTVLLAADLDKFGMDFKIEKIEGDEKYYYATYSFLDLVFENNVWEYQLRERTQKVSMSIKEDLGKYLEAFLNKHYESRLRALKKAKGEALAEGPRQRMEVTEYSGLIGRTLDLASRVFPGYEPVKKRELPAPVLEPAADETVASAEPDNLTRIYNDYVNSHPDLFKGLSGAASSTVSAADSDAAISGGDIASSTLPAAEETEIAPGSGAEAETRSETKPLEPDVEIIELPAPAAAGQTPADPAPGPEAIQE